MSKVFLYNFKLILYLMCIVGRSNVNLISYQHISQVLSL